jgi:hypothetical protein
MMMTAKHRAETEGIVAKIEALADEAAPIEYALSRRLRGVVRYKREALKHTEAGRDYNGGE